MNLEAFMYEVKFEFYVFAHVFHRFSHDVHDLNTEIVFGKLLYFESNFSWILLYLNVNEEGNNKGQEIHTKESNFLIPRNKYFRLHDRNRATV